MQLGAPAIAIVIHVFSAHLGGSDCKHQYFFLLLSRLGLKRESSQYLKQTKRLKIDTDLCLKAFAHGRFTKQS